METTPGMAAAASWFMSEHRRRVERNRGSYRTDPGLLRWCAWEDAAGRAALWIARAVAAGRAPDEDEVAAFRLAEERRGRARDRYLAAERAKREAQALAS